MFESLKRELERMDRDEVEELVFGMLGVALAIPENIEMARALVVLNATSMAAPAICKALDLYDKVKRIEWNNLVSKN